MRGSFLLSLSLHLLGLWLLSQGSLAGAPAGGNSKEKQPPGDGTVDITLGDILPKPQEKEVKVKPQPEVSKDALTAAAHNAQDCPDFYGGIGVVHALSTDLDYVVESVVADYPADRAGMKPGDVVMKSPRSIRGEVGTTVVVPVMRAGRLVEFSMVREKICISKQDKKHIHDGDRFEDLGK